MKILIICTYFPPDTAIAAKRPYMFAKYLSEFGHSVTVLRSGFIEKTPDKSFDENTCGFKIVTYSDFKTGKGVLNRKRLLFLPLPLYNFALKTYRFIVEPFKVYKAFKSKDDTFNLIKQAIDKLDNEQPFDVVFSTYSTLPNIPAGKYAREKFGCKWVLDFRDRIVQPDNKSWLWNFVFSNVEKKAIFDADKVTEISDDLFKAANYQTDKLVTLYNGYCSENSCVVTSSAKNDCLSFFYAGSIYGKRGKTIMVLFEVLSSLLNEGKIKLEHLKINFAGNEGAEVIKMASNYGMESIVVNHGYLQPANIFKLESESDVFLVLSENTMNYQGILTGKFYEGIQCRKPILSIVYGDTPNSELYRLNKTYHYGFCYESCRAKEMEDELKFFILTLYNSKINEGKIDFKLSKQVIEKFDYRNLTRELESLFVDLVSNK